MKIFSSLSLFLVFVSLFGCASNQIFFNQNYSKEKIDLLEKQGFLIEGKMSLTSYENQKNNNQNYKGSFVWLSKNGNFEIQFFNQLANQGFLIEGDYDEKVVVKTLDKSYVLNNLDEALYHILGWRLKWQDLIFWLNANPPYQAKNKVYDTKTGLIASFEYLKYSVQYLSFYQNNKVKLVNLSEIENNKTIKTLKIAIKNQK